MRILRAADRIAIPWKNGGGVTREVCAMPEAGGFDFDWRFSIAEVEASGAFSRFPGIDRNLAILKGRMRLTVDGEQFPEMGPQSRALSFNGAAETFAEVIEPVRDANLMTRQGQCRGTLDWLELRRATTIVEPQAETIILAIEPVGLPECVLHPLDSLWCEPGEAAIVRPTENTARVLIARIWWVGSD